MKKGWTYKKFGELFPIVMGKTPPRNIARYWDEKKETNNLWVSIADLSKNEGKEIFETKEHISDEGKQNIKLIPKGSLLVSFKLTLGKMAFAGDNLYTNEAIMSIQRRKDIDLKFLYFYFSFIDWNKLASGNDKVKGKTLNKKSLSEIPVPYIPLDRQQSIIAHLEASFAHIDALKANAEKQLAEARKLFQAELTECMRPKEGWEEKKLKDIVDPNCPISYGIVQQGDHVEGGVPVVRPIDLNKKYVLVENLKCTTQSISSSYKRTILHGDEILLGVRGTTGIVSIATKELKGCNVNRGIVPLFFKDLIHRDFIYYEMLSPSLQSVFAEKTTGSTLKQINIKDLRMIKFSYPSIDTQLQIVACLDAISTNIKNLEDVYQKTLVECDALKQAMLREIFE